MQLTRSAASLVALAIALAAAPAAAQQVIVVADGTTSTTPRTVSGTDSVTVGTGATLTSTSNPTINWNNASTDLRITNSGTISSTASGGRAINASGSNNVRTVTLVNNAGATITSQDDAFRINVAPSGGTIRIDNYGVIRTTNGGQALDFDAVAGNATIVINNYAGGELRSFGQDAIRPGQGAVVTNAGLIYSDGAVNNNYDGVDWQGRSGTVNNSGTISGLRHGITSDVAVNVVNSGTITGRNGSGIGSDGTGTVVNTGTITGQWDGQATNGDGDGVDIDGIGSVTNSGTIQGLSAAGVDSGGRPNSAEGIAMGGGTIVNNAGATVFGAGNAILINHDTNPGGSADAAIAITNAGTIRATTGYAVQIVGAFNDTITNSGTITGGAAGAIDMGDGDDTLALLTGSVVTGSINGGAGTDTVTLGGAGTGTFAGATNFERLSVTGGSWTLSGNQSYALGTTIGSGATLTGSAASFSGPIANAGALVIDQPTDASFTAAITGAGSVTKRGAGTLTLGSQAYSGATTVAAGRLLLNGTIASAFTVANGATLGGNGTIASLTVQAGGVVAPGNSPGTIIVTGNFTQAAGSTYLAETTAAGLSDRIQIGGNATIGAGAVLNVTRDTGSYAIGTRYTLLTAAGGIAGSYTLVQAAGFATEFRLGQNATAVYVDVVRSGAALAPLASTANQRALAPAFAPLGQGNAAYAALTLVSGDDAVRAGFDSLSGEAHASARLVMLKDSRATLDLLRTHMQSPVEGSAVWGNFTGVAGDDDGIAGTADLVRHGLAGAIGVDVALAPDAVVGLAGGYARTKARIDARASNIKVESWSISGYAASSLGALRIRSAIAYSWTDNRVARAVSFPGFGTVARADYKGNVLSGYGEVAFATPAFGGSVEPFVALEGYRVWTGGFTESGGAAALTGSARREDLQLATAGARAETPLFEGLRARTSLGWQHGLGTLAPRSTLRFAGGSVPFNVQGASLSRDAALASIDLDWVLAPAAKVSVGYSGLIGDHGSESALRATLSIGF